MRLHGRFGIGFGIIALLGYQFICKYIYLAQIFKIFCYLDLETINLHLRLIIDYLTNFEILTAIIFKFILI